MKNLLVVLICLGLAGCASRTGATIGTLLFGVPFMIASKEKINNKEMASWEGHDKNELIATWGAPANILSDGNGGLIYVYSENIVWTTPGKIETQTKGQADTNGNLYLNTQRNNTYGTYSGHTGINVNSKTTYTPPEIDGYKKQRLFWVDSNGKIYRWKWSGL